ncbi:hypothetical protein ACIBO9_10070 [Streptomyces prunicolor]|uniref:hypothetical protein n=1 Tax=Streptomyces prunicolor TaxID=67348 RepID=UPI0037D52BDF
MTARLIRPLPAPSRGSRLVIAHPERPSSAARKGTSFAAHSIRPLPALTRSTP